MKLFTEVDYYFHYNHIRGSGLFTHSESSRGSRVSTAICCVSVFPHDSSKTNIPKLDVQMFHVESWKPIYFGVKGQGHESLL